MSQSVEELDERESSIDSVQSLNEDIRSLRDENLKVTKYRGAISTTFRPTFLEVVFIGGSIDFLPKIAYIYV